MPTLNSDSIHIPCTDDRMAFTTKHAGVLTHHVDSIIVVGFRF